MFQRTFTVEVGSPEGTEYLYANFDVDALGWTGDTGVNTEGDWVQGVPNVTAQYNAVYQTDTCAAGAGCYFTGYNPHPVNPDWMAVESGDVDGGTSIAESPIFDLTGAANPILSYHVWFVSLWGDTQPGDIFTVEVTNGTDTVVIDTIDDSRDEWVERRLSLRDRIDFTSTMQLRFNATDLSGNSVNIVEAAIDEVRVREYNCGANCTSPLFGVNTLKLWHTGSNTTRFVWSSPNTGEWNIHRTEDKLAIPGLWQVGTTLQQVVTLPQYDVTGTAPPNGLYFYQVYGRDSCTGNSVP
jgi:hypothetical protein